MPRPNKPILSFSAVASTSLTRRPTLQKKSRNLKIVVPDAGKKLPNDDTTKSNATGAKNVVASSTCKQPEMNTTDQKWDVERLLARREKDGVTQWCVKWEGYKKATWEPEAFLRNDLEEGGYWAYLIEEFEGKEE
jgi:hypothetical protein